MEILATKNTAFRNSLVLVNVIFSGLIVTLLYLNYVQHHNQHSTEASFQATLIESTFSRTIEALEISLSSLAVDISDGNFDQSHIDELNTKAQKLLSFAPHLRQIVIIHGDTTVVDTHSKELIEINLSVLELKPQEDELISEGINLGSVIRGRFLPAYNQGMDEGSKRELLPISYETHDENGIKALIVAAFNPSYLHQYINTLSNDASDSLYIIDEDGDTIIQKGYFGPHKSQVHELYNSLITSNSDELTWSSPEFLPKLTYVLKLSLKYPFTAVVVIDNTHSFNNWVSDVYPLLLLLIGITIALQVASFFALRSNKKALSMVQEVHLLSEVVEHNPSIIFITDPEGKIQYANQRFESVTGYSRKEVIEKKPSILKSGDTQAQTYKDLWDKITHGLEWQGDLHNKSKSGIPFWVRANISPLRNKRGKTLHFIAVEQVITTEKEALEKVRLASTVFSSSTEGIMVTDTLNNIQLVNKSFEIITGFKETDVIGKKPNLLQSGKHNKEFYDTLYRSLSENGYWTGEIWNKRQNGQIYPQRITISERLDEKGVLEGYVALFSDISKRKRDEELIAHQANYDSLTGLPNRHLFKDRLEMAIHESNRKNCLISLLFMDLDRFKFVNDTYGHGTGDLLLKQVALRLKSCIRATDTIARLGGDEFAIIIGDATNPRTIELIARKVLLAIEKEFHLDEITAYISCSIGIASYPSNASSFEELINRADSAMYKAKAKGKNTREYYNDSLNKDLQQRADIEKDIHTSIENKDFELVFQPIYNQEGSNVNSFEALVRWNHPQKGVIFPDQFIPIAEETGQILLIGELIIDQACSFAKQLADIHDLPPAVCINISPIQFQRGNIDNILKAAITNYAISGSNLTIEITESVLLEDDSSSKQQLDAIVDMGMNLVIDDFGTGYSSLSYLDKFPISGIKIDKSFTEFITTSPRHRAIVDAIISMAQALDLTIVVEGVEKPEQLEYLNKHHNLQIQGYIYSRPKSEDSALTLAH